MDRFVQRSRPAQARQPLAVAASNSPRQPTERPSKRRKVGARREADGDDASSNSSNDEGPETARRVAAAGEPADSLEHETSLLVGRETAIESSLPSLETGKDAIEAYESLRASQQDDEMVQDDTSKDGTAKWVRGKSSIYVDAFNLALDTVLEDETHLFDKNELEVFKQWKALHYEAQYLYMRNAAT
jgi:Fanconi-associated nuclease 1